MSSTPFYFIRHNYYKVARKQKSKLKPREYLLLNLTRKASILSIYLFITFIRHNYVTLIN